MAQSLNHIRAEKGILFMGPDPSKARFCKAINYKKWILISAEAAQHYNVYRTEGTASTSMNSIIGARLTSLTTVRRWTCALAFGGAIALLSACVPAPPAPVPYYQGLLAGNAMPVPANVALPVDGRKRTLALITTAATEGQLEYADQYWKDFQSAPISYWQPDFDILRPEYFVHLITAEIKKRFEYIELVDDFNQARGGEFDYIGVIDIAVQYPYTGSFVFRYLVEMHLLNPEVALVGTIRGEGTESKICWEPECVPVTGITLMRRAVDNFGRDLERVVR